MTKRASKPIKLKSAQHKLDGILEEEQQPSLLSLKLLRDGLSAFKVHKSKKLRTHRLLRILNTEHEGWATFCNGKNLNSRRIVTLLKVFSIHSRTIRFKTGLGKGYKKEWFLDARRRIRDKNTDQIEAD